MRISVRNLIEFVLRQGDIDNRYLSPERAAEGSRIHRMLQKNAGGDYKAEVFFSFDVTDFSVPLTVEGRADGIFTENDETFIDEIKTVTVPFEQVTEDYNELHWAQAMCYGFFLAEQEQLDKINIRLTYFHVETEEIKRFVREFTREELHSFFYNILEKFGNWASLERDWISVRDPSAKALKFPFPYYRRGQRSLAVSVYRTITGKGKLFCQAPTGIGKTVSTLFPAVKAIGEGEAEKIFYLTAKTIARQVAEESCNVMAKCGLRLKSTTLTAKEKICFKEECNCNPDYCEFAKGHFNRVNDALYDLLLQNDRITRETVEEYARKHKVCPFELQLDATLWSDCIICDYNYLFDPRVYLRRFFDVQRGEYVFLVDEAHNLVDRARSMYSAQLQKSTFLALKKEFPKQSKVYKSLNKVNSAFLELRKECDENGGLSVQPDSPDSLYPSLERFTSACSEWLKKYPQSKQEEELLPVYFETLNFLRIADFYDEHYVTMYRSRGSELKVRLMCLDPSANLETCLERGKASVLFSATLTPTSYYSKILGGGEEAKELSLPSPFPRENLGLFVANRVGTRYLQREQSLPDVVSLIYTAVTSKQGHYMVFLPSYAYLQSVSEAFTEKYPDIPAIIQQGEMGETEREDFLKSFDNEDGDTLVGFCVLGGVFSEGIDLKGNRLIGSIIVGVGLPQINTEQDILRDYFNERNGQGFDYAYRYPGMNKVLQAAGRVIRGENDKGIVLLIDDRFMQTGYRSLFPSHWNGFGTVTDDNELREALKYFWEE